MPMTQNREDQLISVIIPVFNAEKFLPACLDSVLAQTHRRLELILVNDTSTDRSLDICEQYAAADARVHVITAENRGISVARNIGVAAAHGDWIAFADSDDFVPPDAYETLLTAALDNGTAIAMGAYSEHHEEGWPRFIRPVSAKPFVCHTAAEAQRYFLTDGEFLTHLWTKLFRRDLFEGVLFPEGRIYEDMAVMPMLLDHAAGVTVVNHNVYHYLIHKGSLSTGVNLRSQMTGLDVRLDYAAYIRAHYPELIGLANDAVMIICCNMLGKIEHVGREKARAEWDRTVSVMRELLPQCALRNAMYKTGAFLFRIDPRIMSHLTHFLLRMDQML